MASFKIFWVIFFVTHQAFLDNAVNAKRAPALYVFGDSSVDAGNNNNLNTIAKANTFPYGIDFNNKSTGRFTNGKTAADIIAIKLGLPMPPPYLGLSESERQQVATGINYASASCGILNNTGNGCLSMNKQIEYFNSTVKNDLPKNIQCKDELTHHLSKSIYLLSVGSNDYLINYLDPMATVNKNKSPEEYADYLLEQLVYDIKRIYDLGGRKFVIVGVGPLGCAPPNFATRPNSTECNENMNQKVKPYSNKLPGKLQELTTQLPGSLFVTSDNFNFFNEIRNDPKKFGFTSIFQPCYPYGAKKPCDNRNEYYFFDFGHPTEAVNEIFAKQCFSGSELCFPINIKELVHAP